MIILCFTWLALPLPAAATIAEALRSVWVNEAIVATYTYDYKNILAQQKDIAVYFTAKGWIAYSQALNDSKLLDEVNKNNYSVSAVATMPPQIKMIHPNYWQATMPLVVVYKNPASQQKQTVNISIEFTAVPSGQGVRGFAITSLQSKQIQPPCQCPIDEQEQSNTPATN